MLNIYLKSMMEELTAKVFRTFNASFLFQNDGYGHFKDVTKEIAPSLEQIGLVTSAIVAPIL